MTRGTTGQSKVLPTNETHLSQILFAGARAIVNFALKKKMDILKKNVLNLNFPSEVFSTSTGGLFGYSSGHLRKTSSLARRRKPRPHSRRRSIPWEVALRERTGRRRFSLAYERASLYDMGCVMGVTPVLLAFRAVHEEKIRLLPKEIWRMDALFCTSVPSIHSKYALGAKALFRQGPGRGDVHRDGGSLCPAVSTKTPTCALIMISTCSRFGRERE